MHRSGANGCGNDRSNGNRGTRKHSSLEGSGFLVATENRGWERSLFRITTKDPGAAGCYITGACLEARGLGHTDSCYELSLLRLFRDEYIAKLPGGDEVLDNYSGKAPRIVEAIEARGDAPHAYLELYGRYLVRALTLIVNGMWDEAYDVYHEMCRDVESRYLKGTGRRA